MYLMLPTAPQQRMKVKISQDIGVIVLQQRRRHFAKMQDTLFALTCRLEVDVSAHYSILGIKK